MSPDMEDEFGHNPTVYSSRAEMEYVESGKWYDDLEKSEKPDGCWNCINFDASREACTLNWNNMDESYYRPDIDDKPNDYFCEYWEEDQDAEPMEEQ